MDQQPQLLQISNHFLRAPHIRFGHDLDQRHAGTIVVHQRAVLPFVMDQLAGIFLHMDLVDTHRLAAAVLRLNLHLAVHTDRQIQLGDLIVLWIVRIEVILPVKLRKAGDLTVGGQSHRNGIFQHLPV